MIPAADLETLHTNLNELAQFEPQTVAALALMVESIREAARTRAWLVTHPPVWQDLRRSQGRPVRTTMTKKGRR